MIVASLVTAVCLAVAPPQPVPAAQSEPPTLGEIMVAFAQDEPAANAKYRGRTLVFTAHVVSVTAEPPALLLEDPAPGLPRGSDVSPVAACVLDRKQPLETPSRDQSLLVQGQVEGLLVAAPGQRALTLIHCALAAGGGTATPAAADPVQDSAPRREAKTNLVTRQKFARLVKRMSYDEVVLILGEPSECTGERDRSMGCTWTNPDGSGVITWFHNGRMSVLRAQNLPEASGS